VSRLITPLSQTIPKTLTVAQQLPVNKLTDQLREATAQVFTRHGSFCIWYLCICAGHRVTRFVSAPAACHPLLQVHDGQRRVGLYIKNKVLRGRR
jgi:hypothetical protein